MDTLRSLSFFVRAVELGSLSAVAREQATTQPTVSKVVAALEHELGVRLLERSTTHLAATPQGQRFYARSKRVLEEYAEAVAEARGQTEQPSGLLRLNAPVALGQFHVNALLQRFLARYPEITVELVLNDRMVDLVEDGVDVALRLGAAAALPPQVVARPLGQSPRWLVAAPAYLARAGALDTPQDLTRHDYVRFAWLPEGDLVALHAGARAVAVHTRGRYRVNNALAIRDALALGGGVGLCPAWLVRDLLAEGRLVRVLPAWEGAAQQLHLLYPTRRYQPLRARLFNDFIAAEVLLLPGFDAMPAAV